jgi:MraZ protein
MFRGTFEHTIDDKGRISVPARFREFLQATNDDRVVITNFQYGAAPCLDVYPHAAWVKLENELLTKPQFNPKVLKFVTFYISGAQDCEIDKQGRILLPPTLRQHAALKKDAVFASALEKFRIWDRETWQQVFQATSKEFAEQPELLDDLGI